MLEINTVIHGDCLKVMKDIDDKSVNLILTDPPYPDIAKDFCQCDISFLKRFECRQLIFWSALEPFLLDFTGIHIWHKPNGRSSQYYERIFERNGHKKCKLYRYTAINSIVSASMAQDNYYKHPTQKPIKLITKLIKDYSKPNDIIFDPFAGSGTTAIACMHTNRNYILIEKEQKYIDIINKRIEEEKKKYRFIL